MHLPWLPETKLLLLEERRLLYLCLQRGLGGRVRVSQRLEYVLDRPDELETALAAWKSACRPRADDLLLLGLPLDLFTIVHFSLPLAAAENLDDAVGFELMRHVPFDLAGLSWRYRAQEEEGRLAISAILAARSRVESYHTIFARQGLNLSAVFPVLFLVAWLLREPGLYLSANSGFFEMLLFDGRAALFQAWEKNHGEDSGPAAFLSRNLPLAENRGQAFAKAYLWSAAETLASSLESARPALTRVGIGELPETLRLDWAEFPYGIDLISPQVMRRRRLWFKLEVGAALFLLLALAGQPLAVLAGKNRQLRKLEKKLDAIRREADKLSGLRQQNQEKINAIEALAGLVREQAVTIDLLKELTEVIPLDSWLNALEIRGRKINLQGTSASATAVLKALEDSPLFKEVHFDSPVVKKGSSETFKIVVELE
ncbi:MAG: PilN domain-containing protein [Deltaproteobacteria bacterium]|nr:PilN domain-containing protein [Deltaproteobacteria bacterium]